MVFIMISSLVPLEEGKSEQIFEWMGRSPIVIKSNILKLV